MVISTVYMAHTGTFAVVGTQPERVKEHLVGVGQHLGVRRIVHVPVVVDRRRRDAAREGCVRGADYGVIAHAQIVPRAVDPVEGRHD